jgi:hypothetical protein
MVEQAWTVGVFDGFELQLMQTVLANYLHMKIHTRICKNNGEILMN